MESAKDSHVEELVPVFRFEGLFVIYQTLVLTGLPVFCRVMATNYIKKVLTQKVLIRLCLTSY